MTPKNLMSRFVFPSGPGSPTRATVEAMTAVKRKPRPNIASARLRAPPALEARERPRAMKCATAGSADASMRRAIALTNRTDGRMMKLALLSRTR